MNIYTDGGCIKANPSKLGGTWAWCMVENNQIIKHSSGIMTPEDMEVETITNNQMELYAAVRAITSSPVDWNGTLYTDSEVSLMRLTISKSFKGIPNWLRLRTLELRRGRQWDVFLLGGHPTRKDLQRGRNRKGRKVSGFNVICDKTCTALAKEFVRDLVKGMV